MVNPASWTKLKIPTTWTVCTYYNIITSLTCMSCSLLLSNYSCSFSLIILITSLLACSPSDFRRTSIGCVRQNSVGLPLAMSVGIPSVLVISVAGLLLVHWQSIGKVRWTDWSGQKWSDQLRKILGKILWWKSRKIWILLTLSPTESTRSPLGKAVGV